MKDKKQKANQNKYKTKESNSKEGCDNIIVIEKVVSDMIKPKNNKCNRGWGESVD